MMRRILVESARNRQRQKRGGGAVHVSLDDLQELAGSNERDLVAISGALSGLATFDARMSQVVVEILWRPDRRRNSGCLERLA
jgi:ECF sigma factor